MCVTKCAIDRRPDVAEVAKLGLVPSTGGRKKWDRAPRGGVPPRGVMAWGCPRCGAVFWREFAACFENFKDYPNTSYNCKSPTCKWEGTLRPDVFGGHYDTTVQAAGIRDESQRHWTTSYEM